MNKTETKPRRGRPPRAQAHETGERPKNRVPLTGRRTRMELNDDELDPNFKYKWINDERGQLDKYTSAGYVFVKTSEGISIGQRTVDTAAGVDSNVSLDVGQGVTAYLMKQPMEYALEDRALRDDALREVDGTLRRDLNTKEDGRYGSVEIT